MGKWRFSAVVCGLLLSATAVSAAPLDSRKDLQIVKDVAASIERYTQFTIFDDVSMNVTDGAVTLSGSVTMPYKLHDIEERVRAVTGVASVVDNISVLPVSTWDDGLRYQIARAIYGHENFRRAATMVNPPIHIVVEHGRVTLTGVVGSEVDRMVARSLASGFGAFSVTNALKTDEEMRDVLD